MTLPLCIYKHPHMVLCYYLKTAKKDTERKKKRNREREIRESFVERFWDMKTRSHGKTSLL